MTKASPFLTENQGTESPLHRLDPRAKIVGFIGFTVVVVSTPARAMWAFAVYAVVLVFLIGLSRLRLTYVLKRASVVVPFVLVVAIFLPFFHRAGSGSYAVGGLHVTNDGLLVLWNAGTKAILGVVSVILLAGTTTFTQMVAGFEGLKAPRILVLIVSFMYRYSFLFLEELRRMRRAMASRNYRARWLWNAPTLGHMLSALFLRSYSRGERVYVAMLSRGYDGTVRVSGASAFGVGETAFLGSLFAVVMVVRVLASL
jgi:cobalt/nickel transport system permease protein